MCTMKLRSSSMNVNEIQNKEVYDGVREAMLQKGVIPKEIIKYGEEIQDKKKLEKMQKDFKDFSSPLNNVAQSIESAIKQYPILSPILTPIKIIVKKAGVPFEIIDYVLEYQINGEEGIIIKIGGKIIETVIFNVGIGIAVAISAAVAGYFASMAIAGAIVGFVVFAATSSLVIWLSNQSEELFRFIYEYIYLPAKDTFTNLRNGFDYLLSGDWTNEFIKFIMFNSEEGKKVLEYELRNKYGDEVDDMNSIEKNYRMFFTK